MRKIAVVSLCLLLAACAGDGEFRAGINGAGLVGPPSGPRATSANLVFKGPQVPRANPAATETTLSPTYREFLEYLAYRERPVCPKSLLTATARSVAGSVSRAMVVS